MEKVITLYDKRIKFFYWKNYDEIKKIHGFDITFVSSSQKDEEVKVILLEIDFPFNKKK